MLGGSGAGGGGLGDDCGVLRVGGREGGVTTLALSIDLSVEGVHFRTDWLSFREIGWRATAAALSDLAADGAEPIGVLVALGVPGTGGAAPATEIMAGVGAAAQSVGASVLGGDLVRSPRYLVDVCVVGWTAHPVRRSGARPGHGIWVTGVLGGAALALARLKRGRRPGKSLFRRYAAPEPRITAGRWLAAQGALAMIDVSDGLAADAGHLAAASGLRLDIELERIPCWPGVAPRAAGASGEEFGLLVALPRSFDAAPALRRAPGP